MIATALQVGGTLLLVVGAGLGFGVAAACAVAGVAMLAFGLAVERNG